MKIITNYQKWLPKMPTKMSSNQYKIFYWFYLFDDFKGKVLKSNWGNWYVLGKLFPKARKYTLKMLDLEPSWRSYELSKFHMELIVTSNWLPNFTFLMISKV